MQQARQRARQRASGRRSTLASILVLTLALLGSVSGCGTGVESVPKTGVDGLVVPTPSPDPADFVQGIDNPWLPYAQGARWTYDVMAGFDEGNQSVTVEPGTFEVAGVDATVVTTRIGAGALSETVRDFYAQDADGNVWWLGREGVWQAGTDGAEAGLAMPADPRLGDGWRLALLPGVVDDRVTVVELTDDAVVLHVRSDLQAGVLTAQTYRRGTGLTTAEALGAPTPELVLVSGP
jgi:hypothetical protein